MKEKKGKTGAAPPPPIKLFRARADCVSQKPKNRKFAIVSPFGERERERERERGKKPWVDGL